MYYIYANLSYHRVLSEEEVFVVRSGREAELWEEVTLEMMSEEEEVYRYPSSYRSTGLNNKFLAKLIKRLDTKQLKHPCVAHRLGSPHEKSFLTCARGGLYLGEKEN